MNTSIKNAVGHAGLEAQYDTKVKGLLVHKEVLAWILIRATDEFKGMTAKEVVSLIEGEPLIEAVPLDPGMTNAEQGTRPDGSKIIGWNTENSEDTEGVIHFDILFTVRTANGLTQIIIDIEPQKDLPTTYSLLNRGFFYISRLISSQKEREFKGQNYDDIKRVYTIFICMNMPENTLNRFSMKEECVLGGYHWAGDRNMLNLVMIGLAKEIPPHDPECELHRLLSAMLSKTMPASKKLGIMEKEYQIKMAEDYKQEVAKMGGFGHAIWEDGVEQGMKQGMKQGIRQGWESGRIEIIRHMYQKGYSIAQIADVSGEKEEDLQAILNQPDPAPVSV